MEESQTLTDHLTELRTRLIRVAWIFLLGFIACYGFSEQIFDILRKPIAPYLPSGGLAFTGVIDKFMAHLKVSFMAGIILTCPLWLYQLWLFIAPGLYSKEKKYGIFFILSGMFFFGMGVAFSYFIVFPAAFKFLLNFGGSVDAPMITITEYLNFVVKCFLGFGITFETPVVLTFLGMMGVITPDMLRKNRRWAMLALSLVAATVTPPDAISMLALLIPLGLLYELSIISVRIFSPKQTK